MAATLLRLPCSYEISHTLEYFVCPPEILQYKVPVMKLEKPMVKFVLFVGPMSFLYVFGLALCDIVFEMRVFLLGLFFGLLSCETDMALLAKKRLKIVAGDYLFIIFN